MATKKLTIDDFTQQPQAKTAQDVNGQDARTRLWQSLDYAYGDQRRKSDQQYAQAVAQADRQALGRGMQRSSYNAQTLANLRQKGIEANNDITSAQIADYQNRIGQIEQQEKEDERWERQFAEQQRQYNEGMALNREQFEEQKQNTAWNQNFQQTQADQSQANWQSQFNAGREDAAQAQQNWQTSFDASRQDAAQSQQNWQTQFDATQAQQKWQNEFAQNQFAYQQTQDQQAQANWQAQFDAQQAQQAWQNEYMQDQFKYEHVIPAQQAAAAQAAAAQAAASQTSYSGRPGNTTSSTPWGKLGISEEEYYRLHPEQRPGNHGSDLFGGNTGSTGGTVWTITGGAGGGKPNVNMTR